MNLTIDLNTVVIILVGALVSWGIRGIQSINHKLNQLNGRVREMNVWKDEHDKLDDEREERTRNAIEALWEKTDRR